MHSLRDQAHTHIDKNAGHKPETSTITRQEHCLICDGLRWLSTHWKEMLMMFCLF